MNICGIYDDKNRVFTLTSLNTINYRWNMSKVVCNLFSANLSLAGCITPKRVTNQLTSPPLYCSWASQLLQTIATAVRVIGLNVRPRFPLVSAKSLNRLPPPPSKKRRKQKNRKYKSIQKVHHEDKEKKVSNWLLYHSNFKTNGLVVT